MKSTNILELILPVGTLEWFNPIEGTKDDEEISIILEEKNIPPVSKKDEDKKIFTKGFTDITITDFPIRGRRTLLVFRRRYWQIKGEKEYLKRDIKLCFPGTQLEKEFANFLKEDGGRGTILAGFYRKVSADPDKRI